MGASADIFAEKTGNSRFLLPVLGASVFSVWLITVTFQLLLIDIAQTFHVLVGTASLVAAVGSISGIATGLLLSVLSVRFNHKLFLMIGLGCTCLAALGFFLASSFILVLIPNIGVGAGIAIVTSMAYALTGDYYPLEKRGKAVGGIVAATALAYVIGAPLIGLIASVGTWRTVMIWLTLPVSLACLLLVFLIVPKKPRIHQLSEKEPFLAGCKQAVANRSILASLSVTALSMAEGGIGFYAISFFRSQFSITITSGSIIILIGNILSAIAGAIAGVLVNRVGRKNLGTSTLLISALLTLSFSFMPTFTLSWVLSVLRFLFSSMAFTAGGSLVIEQLPKFRATMMSLNTAAMNLGILLASVVGGAILNLFNYQTMALTLGGFGVLGLILWVSMVKDPTKNKT
jgi:DHA1 family inner membrane transport protein